MLSARWLKGPIRPEADDDEDPEIRGERILEAVDDSHSMSADELPDPAPEPRAEECDRYTQWARGEVDSRAVTAPRRAAGSTVGSSGRTCACWRS